MQTARVQINAAQLPGRRLKPLSRPLFFLLLTLLVLQHSLPADAAGPARDTEPEQPSTRSTTNVSSQISSTPKIGYTYTVQPGDDVWIIALAHGISMEALVAANGLEKPYLIHPGDTLWVPALPAVVADDLRRAQVPTPTPKPKPPTPQPIATPAVTAAITATAPASVTAVVIEPAAAAVTMVVTEPVTVAVDAVVTGTTAITETAEAAPAEMPPADLAVAEAATAIAPQPSLEGVSEWAQIILDQMNEVRSANGLPPLTWSPELAQAAQAHADDCASRDWGSHVGSDGAPLRTRISRAGYNAVYASENWANTRGPQQAFAMWWNEPAWGPHRLNILGPNYREVGIGVAQGGWGYYFIADFGSR